MCLHGFCKGFIVVPLQRIDDGLVLADGIIQVLALFLPLKILIHTDQMASSRELRTLLFRCRNSVI